MLSRLVITFLPRSKYILISCLQSPSAMILEPPKIKIWIKDLLSMAPSIRTRPSFPLSQSLPPGSFHKPLIFLHQRADRMKTTITEKLTNLIIWTTVLSNSMKLCTMSCRVTQEGLVMVERSDKMWSTKKGNGKPLQYSCLENPMNSMKRQKDRKLKDELPSNSG